MPLCGERGERGAVCVACAVVPSGNIVARSRDDGAPLVTRARVRGAISINQRRICVSGYRRAMRLQFVCMTQLATTTTTTAERRQHNDFNDDDHARARASSTIIARLLLRRVAASDRLNAKRATHAVVVVAAIHFGVIMQMQCKH